MTRPSTLAARTRASMSALAVVALLSSCSDSAPTALTRADLAPRLAKVASASGVVISQVYGGGGNSGATLTHDFIELHNASPVAVSLAGWSVQYASSSGTSWQVTLLSGSIAPGGYYLVQEAQGAGGTTPLPTPEAIGTIAMSGSTGKVALVTATTALTGTGCPAGPTIHDYVGYGSANCFEGTGAAGGLSNTTAALRNGGGTVDTGDNAADFTVGAPNPRNGAAGAPAVASTAPTAGAIDVAIGANLGVTFSVPVTVTGSWYDITCTTSGAHTATVSGGPTTFALDPDADFVDSEVCTATVFGAQVAAVSNPSNVMLADYQWSFTTTSANACTAPFTAAWAIQGSGLTTPLDQQVVTTQGVVVGDYEGPSPTLRGFFLQDAAGDGDAATSDAVFVFNSSNDQVNVGDVVRVTGRAEEFQGQTQLGGSASVLVCSSGSSVTPVDVTLPFSTADFPERYEGMLVRLPQGLFVTEHFQLGRFGEVRLSSSSRLPQPTHLVAPGAAAIALQSANDLNQIRLDDARNDQNADPIVFGRGGQPLSASNTLRGGDIVTGATGVMTYTWAGNSASGNAWRVRPLGALGGSVPGFAATNARPATPTPVGGSLRVAAMNVLNYFNTFGLNNCSFGVGGGAADCRGADDATEFARQADKTVAAINTLGADIVGLIEIENDGYGPTSALADLVGRLNAVNPGWAFIDVDANTGQLNALGTDAIKVALIYRTGAVTPTGTTAALNSVTFVNGGDAAPRNRPSLAQAFVQPNGGRLVVDVNHFKSKGSACDAPDAGDGQGNCALVRTNAATALAAWLASDPTGTSDPDVLVLGDLNAYALEDAVTTLGGAGLFNLIASHVGATAYSYVFDGQWGYLDHALASSTLQSQVTGVTEWHINADEPTVLDYNTDFKSVGQVASLYSPDQYRSADHDPVIVGLNLTPTRVNQAPVANPGGPYSGAEGGPLTLNGGASTDPDQDPLTYAWDFGDGSTGTGIAPVHAFPDNGTYTVTLTVSDGSLTHVATTTATITNVAPTGVPSAPTTGVAGVPFVISLAATDPSPVDAAVLQYRFNCGSGFGPITTTPSATCTLGTAGTYTLRFSVRDKEGAAFNMQRTITITAANAAPVVTLSSPGSITVPVGTAVTISGTFTDAAGDAPWTARAFWGAGQPSTNLGSPTPGQSLSATRTFTAPGTYLARLEVRDNLGATGRANVTIVVQ